MSDASKQCPFCGEKILAIAKKCKHCSSILDSSSLSEQDKPADYGFFLLLIPIIATFLVIFWVGNMNLLQSPMAALMLIALAMMLSTATLAALEVKRAGVQRNLKKNAFGYKLWFIAIASMWGISYPAYLYKRKNFGLPNRLFAGLLVTLIYIICWGAMFVEVEERENKARGNLQRMERSLERLR